MNRHLQLFQRKNEKFPKNAGGKGWARLELTEPLIIGSKIDYRVINGKPDTNVLIVHIVKE